mmetsp:Transcript_51814/g.100124  ORF Transcript_51814/g.100124 Transcript_51814/m.100124 type:complete len:236 (+) Transcript_51814:63-770(+)
MGNIQYGSLCYACIAPETSGLYEGVAAGPRGDILYAAGASANEQASAWPSAIPAIRTHEDASHLRCLAPESPSKMPRFKKSADGQNCIIAVQTPMKPGLEEMLATSPDTLAASGLKEMLAISSDTPAAAGLPRPRFASMMRLQEEREVHDDLDRRWYRQPSVGTWLSRRTFRETSRPRSPKADSPAEAKPKPEDIQENIAVDNFSGSSTDGQDQEVLRKFMLLTRVSFSIRAVGI